MTTARTVLLGVVSAAALAGCGGGGGVTRAPVPEYIDLANRDFSVTSQIGGRLIVSGDSAALRAVSGDLLHSTGGLSDFTDGVSTLNDDTDSGSRGTWQEGSLTLTPNGAQSGSYGYTALYSFTTTFGTHPVVVGVTMDAADIPASGSASYTGEAHMTGSTTFGTSGSLTGSGESLVQVTFGSGGTVNLTIDGVTGLPYDSITINGMVVAGNGFSGGTLTLFDGAADVTDDLLGTMRTNEAAAGDFFGAADGAGNPDEVGGGFFSVGDDGTGSIYGVFIAD